MFILRLIQSYLFLNITFLLHIPDNLKKEKPLRSFNQTLVQPLPAVGAAVVEHCATCAAFCFSMVQSNV